MDLESVGDLAIQLIMENLKPEDIATISCVSNRFRSFTSHDSLWFKICSTELSLTQPIDHLGNPLPSFKVTLSYSFFFIPFTATNNSNNHRNVTDSCLLNFIYVVRDNRHVFGIVSVLNSLRFEVDIYVFVLQEAYQTWREAFVMYPWSLVMRVKRCWDNIKTWLADNFPEAKDTLCQGASEAEIQELEDVLHVKLPLPTRILYRFHNGQEIEKLDPDTNAFGTSLGIIGGYSFYDHLVNVYLLPISQVIQETRQISQNLGFLRRSKYVLVAASSTYSEKLFFLNCTNGQLYVGTRNLLTNRDMIQCVPHDLISLHHELDSEKIQDAMLLWLEEHGRRLQRGFIKLIEEENVRSINLFPEESPLCSTAVTNGVQVGACIF